MNEDDVQTAETVTATENTEVDTTPSETNEPSSMLEAIQDGLKGDEEPKEPEEKQEAESKPDQEPAPENEDEPPEGISKKAQERFRNLTHRLKEKDTELAAVRSDLDGIRTIMQETGGKAEDFGMMFDYMRALNKGDMDHVGKVLAEQVRQYKMMTGKALESVDPLQDFPDLRQRVDSYQMDEQSALELARQRSFARQHQQETAQQQQRHNQTQQFQQVKQQAMAEVDRMGAEWAKRDPDYKIKEELILKQIPVIAQRFHPSQWPQQVEILYQTLSSMPMQRQSQAPQPLRPSGQTAGAKQPTSMLEALKSGLGYSA